MYLAKDTDQCLLREKHPNFAEYDRRFNGSKNLDSTAVVVVHSGNERAVRVVKRSWFVRRDGSLGMLDLAQLLDDVWMAWGFRVNFIYSPKHESNPILFCYLIHNVLFLAVFMASCVLL